MIPYWPQPVWSIGPLTIHAFGVAQAMALVVGFALVLSRAKSSGLEDRRAGWLFIAGVGAGLASGAATYIAIARASWRHPGESATGMIAGVLAVAVGAWVRFGSTILQHIDVLASTAPVIGALARCGCFLAHDHRGRANTGLFAVQFPEGSRIDLGLVECVVALAVAGPVWWLWKSRPPAGVVSAVVVMAAIALRIGLSFLRDDLDI